MKKLKHENDLLKKALVIGQSYARNRGYSMFSDTDPQKHKIECIYRLLVNDKLIVPLPEDKEDLLGMKHRLAVWIQKKLPQDHPLRQ